MKSQPLHHDGRERSYSLHIPAGAQPPAPLLVQLHGRGADGERFDELTGFAALADEAGFVLALPNAIGQIWNDGRDAEAKGPDDVGYLLAVIDDVSSQFSIDDTRVYVAGMSNGAAMAGRLAVERSDRIAAIGQVGGTAAEWIARGPKPALPVPILQVHGTADRFVPYAGGVRHGFWPRVIHRKTFGPSIGVEEWAQFWVAANRASEGPYTTELPPDTTVRTWRDADGNEVVVFYSVEGGGHSWPGTRFAVPTWLLGQTSTTFDATKIIWQFVSAHTRRNISSSM
jgi:polyhydroxybutyrate depolymerase